ncbi:hypothetical protein O181_079018 [Austropuccinia psidii MF-1]|uniref:Uncharacterized protein n=1 Tax=Austropuccinia psidii MF-1 TaxID=1389203 RepID=A0A9Q3IF72_9BASI|nr:hypothetical protein [Austropuccinia psidii MF-1]
MVPPEIEAFERMSLFMKDISIVTGHLSKMITSNYSFNYSTSRRRGRKPTTWLEAWRGDHFQGKSCSYDSLSLSPTENLQSKSPRTTKELNLKCFRHKCSQLSDEDQKTVTTITKNQHKASFIDDPTTNTASEDNSRNNIINSSSNTADDPISMVSITNSSENVRSGLFYNGRTSESGKPPILNDTLVQKTIITSKTSNVSCIDRTKTKASTIKTKNDTSTKTKTTNTTITENKEETIDATATKNKEETIDVTATKNKEETIDATATKNEEETILIKLVNYIERKIKNQPISTKERVSTTLKKITTYIDNEEDIYYLLNSDYHISRLSVSITKILQKEKLSEGILNRDEMIILEFFYNYSINNRNNFYHTDKNIQEIITKIQQTYTIYYK